MGAWSPLKIITLMQTGTFTVCNMSAYMLFKYIALTNTSKNIIC